MYDLIQRKPVRKDMVDLFLLRPAANKLQDSSKNF